jgi:Ni,Fe-hydrogenase maturation factor
VADQPSSSEDARARGVLVVGWGESMSGDGMAGRLVARAVARFRKPRLNGLEVESLTPDLTEALHAVDDVIFVAATDLSLRHRWIRIAVVEPEPTGATGEEDQATTPGHLLARASLAHDRTPRGWLIQVPARRRDIGDAVTMNTLKGMREAVQEILRLARNAATD